MPRTSRVWLGLLALAWSQPAPAAPPPQSLPAEHHGLTKDRAQHPVPLLPGRYVGARADTAQVGLTVDRHGQATLSTHPDKTFDIKDLRITAGSTGPCVAGLDEAPPCWTMVAGAGPAPRPTARPAPWCGTWTHRAPGGSVSLKLDAEGNFALEQSGPADTAQSPSATAQTTGSWHAEADALIIAPSAGGAPLRYRVQLDSGALNLSGGDLAFEVRFEPATTAESASP